MFVCPGSALTSGTGVFLLCAILLTLTNCAFPDILCQIYPHLPERADMEPQWCMITDFLEQTRRDGLIANPLHMVDRYRKPVKDEIDRLNLDLSNEDVVFAFMSGLVEHVRIARQLWQENVRTKQYYKDSIQDLFTCMLCIEQYLPQELFAKYFNPLLS